MRASASLEADESLLTGESEPVGKRAGDAAVGSFVIAGRAATRPPRWARMRTCPARRPGTAFALVRRAAWTASTGFCATSPGRWAGGRAAGISGGTPMGTAQVASGTVAALVGMVPQGLVLLTSVAFGVAAVTLARRRVLVQQPRGRGPGPGDDAVCLDKTGTLTDGTIGFDSLIRLDGQAPGRPSARWPTTRTATRRWPPRARPAAGGVAAAGSRAVLLARKWSAASFAGHGTWVLGAPEMVLPGGQQEQLSQAAGLAASGRRVLVLAHAAVRWTASRSRRAAGGGLRPARRACGPTPPRPSRTSPGRGAEGDLRGQPAHRQRGRRACPTPAGRSMPGICPRTPARSAACWRSARSSAG